MRVITLDENSIVISVKWVGEDCELGARDFVSELGEMGQIRQEDGTFIDPEPEPLPEPLPTLEEMQAQTLLNTEYLVCLAEISNL